MPFDEQLAARVRRKIGKREGIAEKKMFGGLAFLLHGNMSCGILRDDLIVRLGPESAGEALKRPGARVFDITGRTMKGWVLVGGASLDDDKVLGDWVRQAVKFAAALPKK